MFFRYHHFVSTSSLLIIPASVPVHDYFVTILRIIKDSFKQNLSVETFELLLRWSEEIIIESRCFMATLIMTDDFRLFLSTLCLIGKYPFSNEILLKVAFCLELLISNSDVILQVGKIHYCCLLAVTENIIFNGCMISVRST